MRNNKNIVMILSKAEYLNEVTGKPARREVINGFFTLIGFDWNERQVILVNNSSYVLYNGVRLMHSFSADEYIFVDEDGTQWDFARED